MSAAELSDLLQREYSVEALLQVGVMQRCGNDLGLSPVLSDGAKVFISHDDQQRPVDMYNAAGSICNGLKVAIQYGGERNQPQPSPKQQYILLVESDDDLQILRELRCRAACSTGLDALTGKDARRWFAGDPGDDRLWRYKFFLADFSFNELVNRRLPRAKKIVERFELMREVYNFDPSRRLTIWRPGPKMLRMLAGAVHFRDAPRVRELIQGSYEQASDAAETTWHNVYENKNLTLSATRARLQSAIQKSNAVPMVADVALALKNHRHAFDRLVLNKLDAKIDSATGPLDPSLLLSARELMEIWFENQSLVQAANRVLSGEHPSGAIDLDLTQRLRIGGFIRQIRRDLTN